MAGITIRNVDDDLKQRLKEQAAVHGRSMEAEARGIGESSLLRTRGSRPGRLGRPRACQAS
jgi:plasmid stability protein